MKDATHYWVSDEGMVYVRLVTEHEGGETTARVVSDQRGDIGSASRLSPGEQIRVPSSQIKKALGSERGVSFVVRGTSAFVFDFKHLNDLEAFRQYIGCDYVDVIRLSQGIDMWVDDEGLINGSEFNRAASDLVMSYARSNPDTYPAAIFGTALVCGVTLGGDSRNLTKGEAWDVALRLGIGMTEELWFDMIKGIGGEKE